MAQSSEELRYNPETRRKNRKFDIAVIPCPEPENPIITPELSKIPSKDSYPLEIVRATIQGQADQTARTAEIQSNLPKGSIALYVTGGAGHIEADFAVAAHPLAKALRQTPTAIAEELAHNASAEKGPYIQTIRAENGYVNFELDAQSTGKAIVTDIENKGDRYGEVNVGHGETVVIDYSAPNIAKFMSVGHLRSTVIGESLVRIHRAGGYRVIGDNHIGDWGTQFGMLGRAVELWGKEVPEITGANPVQGLYGLYVRMHHEVDREKEEHKATHPDEKNYQTPLEKEGRAWFQRLESGDPQAHRLLKWATSISNTEFQRVYALLGVKFQYQLGESAYVPMLDDVNRALLECGVGELDERGGLVVKFKKEEKLGEKLVVRKSDGTSLYATRDIATLAARQEWFGPKKILYVVGGEQQDYFRQLFSTYQKLAGEDAPELQHVHFGMMKLPEGKMSTRKGRVIFLEDVLNEAIMRARAKVTENNPNLSSDEIDHISRQVGVGAVTYMDLGQGRERNIQFDWDKALSFQGNSGPYLQYAHARATSILRRAQDAGIVINEEKPLSFEHPSEKALVKHLGRMHTAVTAAISESQPTRVASYTYGAAELFSSFYNNTRVLEDPNPDRRDSKLRLTAASAQVLRNGLHLLGMQAPTKM